VSRKANGSEIGQSFLAGKWSGLQTTNTEPAQDWQGSACRFTHLRSCRPRQGFFYDMKKRKKQIDE
jgi:hypothetical protein